MYPPISYPPSMGWMLWGWTEMNHVHAYEGRTSVDMGHRHTYEGVTGPGIPMGTSHVHPYSGETSYNRGHNHTYSGMTGPAQPAEGGGHTHTHR